MGLGFYIRTLRGHSLSRTFLCTHFFFSKVDFLVFTVVLDHARIVVVSGFEWLL